MCIRDSAGADSPETGHLDVGAQVVAQLHDNHEMGWEFTDAEAAINGVYEGRYWAALVIPKDFSEDFASVFTGDFTQPTLSLIHISSKNRWADTNPTFSEANSGHLLASLP